MDASEVWARCLLAIEQRISRQSFQTWFRPTRAVHADESSLVVEVPSNFFAEWLEGNFLPLIQSVLLQQLSFSPTITFSVADEGQEPQPFVQALSSDGQSSDRRESSVSGLLDLEAVGHFNPRYTFESFVVGSGNQLVHAAAVRVAESPGHTSFNPLVIYGGVGLGKTHLLQAIGHRCLSMKAGKNVIYVSSEKFFTDFIHSISNRNTERFAHTYRSADVLLIDDIQFFLHSEATQREFFHTFNALHQNRKQIVLSSDSPPGDLKGLEERLLSRFQWGLVVGIDPPDLETRIAILQSKASRDGVQLPQDVASFIANRISSNVRELEGSLIKLLAYASIKGCDLSLQLATEALQSSGGNSAGSSHIAVDLIKRCVARHFGLADDLLIGKSRKQEIAIARQVGMYLTKKLTNLPLKSIGLHFGGRDHSTVIHACQLVERRIQGNPSFKAEVESLSRSLIP